MSFLYLIVSQHLESGNVHVEIWMRTPIRPVPLPNRLPPVFYQGDNCTYAYIEAEQEETEGDSMSVTISYLL